MSDETKNIFTLVPKAEQEPGTTVPAGEAAYEPETEVYTYSLQTKDGHEYVYDGFLIFNNSSAVIMRETGPGTAIPILVVPFDNLALAELVEDE